jgi:endonuclease I
MVATAAYSPINSQKFSGSRSGSTAAPKKGPADDYYDEVGDAVDRDKYYASVKDSFATADGAELYSELHDLVSHNVRDLGYNGARHALYNEVDRRPDGNLYYIYSGEGPKNEQDVTKIERHDLGNYNCEHVVPQSWFNKKLPMRADLHHLFTEQVQCNGIRANYELTHVEGGETVQACGIVDKSDGGFEPKAGKGEVARATLYFVTRHPGYIGDKNETQLADVKQMIEWSKQYPVTDYERHRNDKIQDVQGNRNPFIDFPELVDKVDFTAGFKH